MDLLDAMFESHDYHIRMMAAEDKAAPLSRLVDCIEDRHSGVQYAAFRNARLPIKYVTDYIRCNPADYGAIRAYLNRTDLDTTSIWTLYLGVDSTARACIAQHTSDSAVQCRIALSDRDNDKQALAKSSIICNDAAILLLKSGDTLVMLHLVKNHNTKVEILEKVAAYAKNLRYAVEVIEALLANRNSSLKVLSVIRRSNISELINDLADAELKRLMLKER
jgi:hypothetical protein